MAILLDQNTEVLIQGITGRQARQNAQYMSEYGTRIVAGVTPGKGGTDADGIPVYNSVKEAREDGKRMSQGEKHLRFFNIFGHCIDCR